MSAARWREEDEALLSRLTDYAVVSEVWAHLSPRSAPLPPRAAGLVRELRQTERGREAVEQAQRTGDYAALARTLSGDDLELTPRLAHHLALLLWRLSRDQVAHAPAVAERTGYAALTHWLWLAEEGTYLGQLAHAVVGSALPTGEVDALANEVVTNLLSELGARARAGAESLSRDARVALMLLSRVGDAAGARDVSDEVTRPLLTAARRERNRAIDEAIGRVDAALDEAILRQAATTELRALLADLVAVWRFTDRDELVERYAVRRITPTIWDLYRAKRWDEIRSLLHPLEPLIDHMGQRIEKDPSQLAYAAPCAQMFVFRAEAAPVFADQIRLTERALALCETHRNARLVLADLLTERALRSLDGSMPWGTGDALNEAATDLRRAEALYPQLKRLAKLKQRMAELGYSFDD